jgi:hypothetical protein
VGRSTSENLYLAVYRRLFQQLTQMRQGMLELLEMGSTLTMPT